MGERGMLGDRERRFLETRRVAHLATADANAVPHVVPVCFGLADDTVYIAIDQKPKRPGARLKRLANLTANPHAAMVFDHYAEDWRRLGWVMLHGRAEILATGPEHDEAQSLLRRRYPQYLAMQIIELPVIAIRIDRAVSWGELAV